MPGSRTSEPQLSVALVVPLPMTSPITTIPLLPHRLSTPPPTTTTTTQILFPTTPTGSDQPSPHPLPTLVIVTIPVTPTSSRSPTPCPAKCVSVQQPSRQRLSKSFTSSTLIHPRKTERSSATASACSYPSLSLSLSLSHPLIYFQALPEHHKLVPEPAQSCKEAQ